MKDKKMDFIRIAENRTNRIISAITLLGNLANKANYSYTDEQIDKIFSAINDELVKQKQKFQDNDKNSKKFRL